MTSVQQFIHAVVDPLEKENQEEARLTNYTPTTEATAESQSSTADFKTDRVL